MARKTLVLEIDKPAPSRGSGFCSIDIKGVKSTIVGGSPQNLNSCAGSPAPRLFPGIAFAPRSNLDSLLKIDFQKVREWL